MAMKKRDHNAGKLVAITLAKLPDGWHADGGNLYLFVRGNSRVWVFRYTAPDGKRRRMGLGSFGTLSLAAARDQAKALREKARNPVAPIDPIRERQQQRVEARVAAARSMTFKACASAYIEAKRAEWKNPKHGQQWANTLATYVYPLFGDVSVAEVDTAMIIKCLQPIWTSKTETATRIRERIESVLDWATTSEFRNGDNPARWRGHLENKLARPSKIKKVKHHAALPYSEIGAFMADLRKRLGGGAKALEFTVLTAARSGEVRGATWGEFDLGEKVWTVPGERMKAGKEHRVPLSDAAIAILEELAKGNDDDFVFPSIKAGRPLSDMSLTAVLRRMGNADLTVHGFRSTFRDWAADRTNFPREVCEQALAHQLPDKVEAAYRRSDLFVKRSRLMAAWAEFCSKPAGEGKIISLDSKSVA